MPISNSHSAERLQPLPQPQFDRRQLLSYEVFEAAHLPRRPAIHIPPLHVTAAASQTPRPTAAAAAPVSKSTPSIVIEPIEPIEPCSSLNGRFGSSIPARSRLSPSQRAAARCRPEVARDQDDRNAYVTYTIEPR
jgi:hypothetical protein